MSDMNKKVSGQDNDPIESKKLEPNNDQNETKKVEAVDYQNEVKKVESDNDQNEVKKVESGHDNKNGILQRVKASFTSRKFKQGAYATTISAIVLVIVVVINMFVSQMDVNIDITADGKFTLTKETVDLVKGIKDDIKIYYLVQSGKEIEEFSRIIDNYNDINSKVSVVYKDPVQYPKFASEYVDDKIQEQSFLVVNETTGAAKYLGYGEVINYDYNQNTGDYSITGLNIESKVDAALQVVTNKDLPVVYSVTGHSETGISTQMGTLLTEGNVTHSNLNSLTTKEIPKDCDILFINQPQSDYTKEEADLILNYLKAGGKAVVCVDYTTPTLANFSKILDYYGVDVVEGIVVEGDSNCYVGNYQSELVPTVMSHEFTKDFKDKKYIVSAASSGLVVDKKLRDTLTFSEILRTSDSSYSKTNMNSSVIDKEKGDVDGGFLLGVDVTEKVGEKQTRLIVYSGKYMWDDRYLAEASFANVDLLYNTINKMTGQENVMSVRPVSLAESTLVMTQGQKNRVGLLVMGVIPFAFIVPGVIVVVRRRKK